MGGSGIWPDLLPEDLPAVLGVGLLQTGMGPIQMAPGGAPGQRSTGILPEVFQHGRTGGGALPLMAIGCITLPSGIGIGGLAAWRVELLPVTKAKARAAEAGSLNIMGIN
jgi:hypothetical protein